MRALTDISDRTLGFVASFALPALGGVFKNPVYGAVGGLIGGAVSGLLSKHSGWNLVSDMAIGMVGGGLGASFGRKGAQALVLEGKSGSKVGEALRQITRGERAQITASSMSMAGSGSALPMIGKDLVINEVTPRRLPTTSAGRGDG